MLLAVLAHIPSQFYYVYSNVFFNWTGMPAAAAKMTLGQVVEVGCMLLLPVVILRVSVKAAIVDRAGRVVGPVFDAGRRRVAARRRPRRSAVSPPSCLHGVAFTLVTISLQLDVDRCAGRQRRATAQGLFSVAVQGFGCFAGAQLAGAAGARWLPTEVQHATVAGWQAFWLLPACGSAAVLLLTLRGFAAGNRGKSAVEGAACQNFGKMHENLLVKAIGLVMLGACVIGDSRESRTRPVELCGSPRSLEDGKNGSVRPSSERSPSEGLRVPTIRWCAS